MGEGKVKCPLHNFCHPLPPPASCQAIENVLSGLTECVARKKHSETRHGANLACFMIDTSCLAVSRSFSLIVWLSFCISSPRMFFIPGIRLRVCSTGRFIRYANEKVYRLGRCHSVLMGCHVPLHTFSILWATTLGGFIIIRVWIARG